MDLQVPRAPGQSSLGEGPSSEARQGFLASSSPEAGDSGQSGWYTWSCTLIAGWSLWSVEGLMSFGALGQREGVKQTWNPQALCAMWKALVELSVSWRFQQPSF